MTENSQQIATERPMYRRLNRLALMYEGILTAVVRVRTRKQPVQDLENFRTRMKEALSDVDAAARERGYASTDIEESKFAVVAFVDEVILTAPGSQNAWVGKTLGEEIFQQRSAGELFFRHLDSLRASPDSQNLAEVLEVYYYCLLLGYEGKFADSAKGELLQIIANLRDRIELIFGRDPDLSPDKALPAETPAPRISPNPLNRQLRLFALVSLAFAFLCYTAFSWHLHNLLSELRHAVDQRVSWGGKQ